MIIAVFNCVCYSTAEVPSHFLPLNGMDGENDEDEKEQVVEKAC